MAFQAQTSHKESLQTLAMALRQERGRDIQPVGIGEQSDVMAAIDGEINAIAQAHEKIEIINHYFLNR